MKIYKRHLPKLVSELILNKTDKLQVLKFIKGQGETKESVLQIAKSPDYICQKSELIGNPRSTIAREIELIETI